MNLLVAARRAIALNITDALEICVFASPSYAQAHTHTKRGVCERSIKTAAVEGSGDGNRMETHSVACVFEDTVLTI